MKKILSFLIILLCLASCSEKPEPIAEAQNTVDKIFVANKKLGKNQMTESDYNKVAVPLHKKLDSLKLLLNPDERQQLENYAEKRFGEIFQTGIKN
ncbi:hypothetical protein LB465_03065 [Salegentibacter sp. LM13S]|uniref:hypothetical protein n=1 Tax=Salegentibacter lacus TaxID=2873599 RepID=UPI001CCDFCFC|nr:hypothetical protein [Salegentibacter lacus]MBZ9629747.1 hypothetical protein [Salegentibacter lacus]